MPWLFIIISRWLQQAARQIACAVDDSYRLERGGVVAVKNQMLLEWRFHPKHAQSVQLKMAIATHAAEARMKNEPAQCLVQAVEVALSNLVIGMTQIPFRLAQEVLCEDLAFLESQRHFLRFFFRSLLRRPCISSSE